jgi:hypothetical protein
MFSKLLSLSCMNGKRSLLVLSFLFSVSIVSSQEVFKTRPSPIAITSVRFKDAYLKITYAQPQARGRKIFGALIPYGEVWRTGANEATEITLTRDVIVNNQLLKAGTYSIFTIPQKDRWTIIINADVGLWGAYNYNTKLDVMRFDVPAEQNNVFFEAFTILFDQKNDLADLLIMWDDVKLTIPFKFIN